MFIEKIEENLINDILSKKILESIKIFDPHTKMILYNGLLLAEHLGFKDPSEAVNICNSMSSGSNTLNIFVNQCTAINLIINSGCDGHEKLINHFINLGIQE